MKRISILLPYKENFSSFYAGAVSLFVKDTTIRSRYKKDIVVFGHTNYKSIFNVKYKNIALKKNFLQSGSKSYVQNFLRIEQDNPSDIIEIHNRPNYIRYLHGKINGKIVLYFHNDPLSMVGSKSISDRIYLLNNVSKIIFNSEWSKLQFLNSIDKKYINSDKLLVVYQSANKPKLNLKSKKNWITFVGKLNTAKGYDLFGNAIVKILNKYSDWYGIVIGDERRLKLDFHHPRLKKMGFLNHKKVLQTFSKTSIAVACSRWDEPLGRTGLEASSRGCAVIITNRGGLPETITHGIILKTLSIKAVYNAIKNLIENTSLRKKLQILSAKNFNHTHKAAVDKMDHYRDMLLQPHKFFITLFKNKEKLKILHVTNFNERHDGRLFFNTGRRINNGFIRLNHSVLDFSDRDIVKHYKGVNDFNGAKNLNDKLIKTVDNFRPNLLVLGHADLINTNTLQLLKNNYSNMKFAQWFLDRMDGPWLKNKKRFLDKVDFMDANFLTTSPEVIDLPKKNNFYFIPNPSDESIENLNNYLNKECTSDVFFALSHGVHRGILKKGKYDEREKFINKLIEITPNTKFDVYGINNNQPIWADAFYKALSRCKMAINLSQGKPIKYYSSDRVTQLIGNGLLTFIDEKTHYHDFFTNKEVVFYKNISDLSEKIKKYTIDDKSRKNIAKRGKEKYMKHFNSTVVAEYIINKTFQNPKNKKFYLWEK